jgi:hypothetical protein
MVGFTRIPLTLTPRTDHHKNLHPDTNAPREVIYDAGVPLFFDITNKSNGRSFVFFCWRTATGPVPLPEGHNHDDHDHPHETASTGTGTAAAAQPATIAHGQPDHAHPDHGNTSTAAYHHVLCEECMAAEGLDFAYVEVPKDGSASIELPRNEMEVRRSGTNFPHKKPFELRQIYIGALYDGKDKELHKNKPRPPKRNQLGWLFFIEHPFYDPPHPDHIHRHHTENVILEN